MQKNIIAGLVFMLLPLLMIGQAQTKDSARLKPPKLESFWGMTQGGTIRLEDVISLLDSPVIIFRERKEKITLAKAILVYRSKDAYEDESTGNLKTRYNSYSCSFRYNNQLPENWKKFLKENMKPGDKLHIADIHVKDKNGYLYAAPDIKINID